MTGIGCERRFLLKTAVGLFLVSGSSLAGIARAVPKTPAQLPDEVAGVPLPKSDVARQATMLAAGAYPPFLFNHCLRTFLFGALAARKKQLTIDAEALFVAGALHDLGLIEKYQSQQYPFEIDGADAAKKFLEQHGVNSSRIDLIWDAIAMHSLSIASRKAPEVRLIAFGAGADVFGGGLPLIGERPADEVLAAFPRLGFNSGFKSLILGYCAKKPRAQAGSWTDAFCRSHLPEVQFPSLDEGLAASPFKE